MRWGEERTVQFVKLYRKLECLWNIHHPDYKNKHVRLSNIEHLVSEMGIPNFTVKDACKKIRSLRSTFNQELKKFSESLKCDAGTDKEYKLTLRWFEDMEYIMNMNNAISEGIDSLDNLEHDQELESLEESSDHLVGDVIEEAIIIDPSPSRSQPTSTTNSLKRLKRGYKFTSHQEAVPAKLAILDRSEDECDVIAKHIALQLRQLPTSDMLQANVEIQQVLLKYRLANLDDHKKETFD